LNDVDVTSDGDSVKARVGVTLLDVTCDELLERTLP
jgi:hypothetical protein